MVRHALHLVFFGVVLVGALIMGLKGSSGVRTSARLLELDTRVQGVLQDEYEEVTVTLKGAKIVTYNFTYDFTYDGKDYTGTWRATKLPDEIGVEVFIDPANPEINAVNPQSYISSNSGSGKFFYAVTLVALLLVLYKAYRIKRLVSGPKATIPA